MDVVSPGNPAPYAVITVINHWFATDLSLTDSQLKCPLHQLIGRLAVVQPAPDSSISEVICTNLDYAQYSCAPKRGEHGDGHPTDSRTRRGHSA